MTTDAWRVGIDAGGTFTDAIAQTAAGRVLTAKSPSTPADPAAGLLHAISALVAKGLPPEKVSLVCHGTTVATNAALTGTWARVVLITTAGFGDVLAYRTGSRPDVYSLSPAKPTELVPRTDRIEVAERIGARGEVVAPLLREEVRRVVQLVRELGPDSVAVSFLFSYVNDAHERLIGAALREALPTVPVTLSSEIAREFREYPRTATTVINAALRPVVGSYLGRAESAIASTKLRAPFVVMQSNGGSVPVERADTEAHRLLLSGPAGGVAALVELSRRYHLDKTISLDMGGTSTDVCLLQGETPPMAVDQRIADHRLLVPTVDIHTIGAGGGSIAWVDPAGRLRVGPQSAKAEPGPACYGRGGTAPTVTDAHVVLGTLGGTPLAGGLELDRGAAEEAVARVAQLVGKSVAETAEAILAIAVAHMVRALRKVSIERGLDPREFTLVPFGGAGPLHAGLLVRHLRLRDAIIPLRPGLFSAEGLLGAGLKVDDSQTVLKVNDSATGREVLAWFKDHADAARAQLVADGMDRSAITLECSVDCRYLGQGFELSVPLESVDEAGLTGLPARFNQLHRQRYGHANDAEPIEIVTLRISASGAYPDTRTESVIVDAGREPQASAMIESRRVTIPGYGTSAATPVWDRALLRAGDALRGPAVVHQMDSTTVILPGQSGSVTNSGDIRIAEEK